MKSNLIPGVLVGVFLGVAVGIGLYTFAYAKGWSYLTDDPAACANCQVMREQFDGWLKSSHRSVATCNSCHTPANFVGKYATKASNGFWHSFFFTTGGYEDNIQIKPHSREITEQACRNCHQEIVDAMSNITSRDRKSGSSILGPKGSRSRTFKLTMTRRSSKIGPTPTPALLCSKHNIQSSSFGTKASTRVPA